MAPGGGSGASLFGGLIGGGAVSAAQNYVRQQMAQIDQAISKDAARRSGMLASVAGGAFGQFGPIGGGANFAAGIARGAGPGILGIGGRTLLYGLGGSVGLGALPGLLGPAAGLLGGIGGLGATRLLSGAVGQSTSNLVQLGQQLQNQRALAVTPLQKQQVAQQQASLNQAVSQLSPALQSVFKSMMAISDQWQQIGQNLAPAFAKPLATVARLFVQLTPLIQSMFRGALTLATPFISALGDLARMILPQLAQMFRATAPLIRPLIDGLGLLVHGLLAGLISIIRATAPDVKIFAATLGQLGKDLGGLFTAAAPAVRAGSQILAGLLKIVGGLLPVVGQLATVMAKALAPVFGSFATVVRVLEPVLVTIGKVIGSLAAAMIVDLVAAFRAIASLVKAVSPAFQVLAKALSGVFTVLENSGFFAILATSLEKIAKPLGQLVSALLTGLAPILSPLIRLVSALAGVAIKLLSGAILAILPTLTTLITTLLQPLGPILQALVPVVTVLANLLASGLAAAIVAIVKVASPLLIFLARVVAGFLDFLTRTHLLIPVLIAVAAVLYPIPTAIAAIGIAIGYLVTHWTQVWGEIKRIAADAWNFIWNGWGKYLLAGLGPFGAIAIGAIELAKHWGSIWATIKQVAANFYQWFWADFGAKITNFMIHTLPAAFSAAVSAIQRAWTAVENAVKTPINFVIRYVLDDGLIKAFNLISHVVGGPTIPTIPTLATGGRIPGYGGGDRHLALLEGGEAVVSKETTAAHASELGRWGVPGFQHGGRVPVPTGPNPFSAVGSFFGKAFDAGRILAALATNNTTALVNAIDALIGKQGMSGAVGDLAAILADIPKTLVLDAVHKLESLFSASSIGVSGNIMHIPGKVPLPVGSVQTYAMKLLNAYGWAGQFGSLNALIMGESGWRWNATNPSSGAYGIPQALPASKMASAGPDWRTNPFTQIRWMFGYLKSVYGSPARAYAMWLSRSPHWYDQGGWMEPGLSFNGTRRREAVLTPAQSDAFIAVGEAARMFARGHGTPGPGGGSLMRDIYLTLPEGSTVAQALNEITFHLAAARMNGYAGVLP